MKYSRKQIFEAIKYWEKQLSIISESTELAVDDVNIKVYTDSDEINNLIENVIDMVIKTYVAFSPLFLQFTTSIIVKVLMRTPSGRAYASKKEDISV